MLLSNSPPSHSLKTLVTATAVIFGLLLFMASLVTIKTVDSDEKNWHSTPIFQQKIVIDDNYNRYNHTKPKPKPKFTPAPPITAATSAQQPFEPVHFDKATFSNRGFLTGITGPKAMGEGIWSGATERTASLTNPVAARYPAIAIEKELEGYVDVIFDITPTGTTTNVRVLAAEPARVFNRNAIRAVKKWKYRPQLEGGKAVMVSGVVARVHFELEK